MTNVGVERHPVRVAFGCVLQSARRPKQTVWVFTQSGVFRSGSTSPVVLLRQATPEKAVLNIARILRSIEEWDHHRKQVNGRRGCDGIHCSFNYLQSTVSTMQHTLFLAPGTVRVHTKKILLVPGLLLCSVEFSTVRIITAACNTYFVFGGVDDYSRRSRIGHLRRQRSSVPRSGTIVQGGVDSDVEHGVVAASRDHARLLREHRRDGYAGDIVVIRGVEGRQVLPRRGVPGLDVDACAPSARRHLWRQYCIL